MDPTEIIKLLNEYGPTIVFLGLTIGALVWVVLRLLKEMAARTQRAEVLVDQFKPSIDDLAGSVDSLTEAIKEHTTQGVTQTAVLNALLEEWRRK